MKTVFIHYSEKIREDDLSNLYTDGSYNSGIWNRYIENFGSIETIFRKDPKIYNSSEAENSFNKLDKRIKVSFLCDLHASILKFLNIKNRLYNKKLIRNKVSNSDFFIVRGHDNLAIREVKRQKKPYLIEVVGCPFDSYWNHSIKGKLLAISSYFSLKKAVCHAPYVIYVSESFLQKRYPTKGKSVGVSDVYIKNIHESISEQKLEALKVNHKIKTICTVGAVDIKYKNQEVVLKAIATLKEKGLIYNYNIIGGGNQEHLLELARKLNISSQVSFTGAISHEKVFNELLDCDIYVQPSLTEGLPRATIEALSVGCLTLGSKVGGIPELVEEKYLFSSKNYQQLSDIIENLNESDFKNAVYKNVELAKKYQEDNLRLRRNTFYSEIIKDALNNQF